MILTTDPYDPQAAEDGGHRPNYFTKKDLRNLAIIAPFVFALFVPMYYYYKKGRDRHVCKSNIFGTYKSILLYAENCDGRLPPLYAKNPDGSPVIDEKGRVFTWVSLVEGYQNGRTSASCPSAHEEENCPTQSQDSSKVTLQSSYGMYGVLSAYPRDSIPNETKTVLIAETSDKGSLNTFDPHKLPGSPTHDGFAIGFDDGNEGATEKTKYVTRLAFEGTGGGKFKDDGITRHDGGIWAITAGGHLLSLKPDQAEVKRLGKGRELIDHWTTPPPLSR